MSETSINADAPRRAVSDERLDKFAVIVPVAACFFACVVSPLILLVVGGGDLQTVRPENRVVWPILATAALALAALYRSRPNGLAITPQMAALMIYLALAATSVFWAFSPQYAFKRFVQQLMIVASIVVPTMLAGRMAELMRGMFLCFAFAALLNLAFVFGRPTTEIGHPGYFASKNQLGELAAMTLFFSLWEARWRGARRAFAIFMIGVALFLLVAGHSKTSLGLVVFTPAVAAFVLAASMATRISAAIVLVYLSAVGALCYVAASVVFSFNVDDVSLFLFGDPSFTGRTTIWAFATGMIAQRPLLGWGYQSFWLVGPDAPSVLQAPGWVADMPHAHDGYLDTMLETGVVGLAVLVAFLLATVHAIGGVAKREPMHAWLALSLVLFIMITNGLETTWLHGFDPLWLVFLVIAAEPRRPGMVDVRDGSNRFLRQTVTSTRTSD